MAQPLAFVVAVYCYAPTIPAYLRQDPLMYFSNAGPALQGHPYGTISEQRLS